VIFESTGCSDYLVISPERITYNLDIQELKMDWSKGRYERHQATFPPEEKAERNRVAQETYRRRNRERIAAANTARAILVRQNWYAGDAEALAAAITSSIGKDCAKELIVAFRLWAPAAPSGADREGRPSGGRAKTTRAKSESAATKAKLKWKRKNGCYTAAAGAGIYNLVGIAGASWTVTYGDREVGGPRRLLSAAKALAQRDWASVAGGKKGPLPPFPSPRESRSGSPAWPPCVTPSGAGRRTRPR
jgi:hypothetical protein